MSSNEKYTENKQDESPLPRLTVDMLFADSMPAEPDDSPEARLEGGRYLATKFDTLVGEGHDPQHPEMFPEGTKIASSHNIILGKGKENAYRPNDGLVDITRVQSPDGSVEYSFHAHARLQSGAYLERDLSITVNGDDVNTKVYRPEYSKTGEMEEASVWNLGEIEDFIDGKKGKLHSYDPQTQEVSHAGSYARIVNKSRMRKLAKALRLTR